jgi:hypothetical protein
MNRVSKWIGIVPWFAGMALLGACHGVDPDTEPTSAVHVEAPTILDEADSVYAAPPDRDVLPSQRIYYTLTDHEWYARGEPLLHGDLTFHPAGMPVAASVAEMELVGEYQGVDYYLRRGDASLSLYIPVFEGYWQSFRPDTSARGPG